MTFDLCKPLATPTPAAGYVPTEPTRSRSRSRCGRFNVDPMYCPTCGRPAKGIHVLSVTGQVFHFADIVADDLVAEVIANMHSYHEPAVTSTQIELYFRGVHMKAWHKLSHYGVVPGDCLVFQLKPIPRCLQITIMG